MDADTALRVAVDAARAAGELLRDRFGGPASGVVAKSSGTDMVSDADRDAERLLVDAIRAACPGDGIVGEEGAAVPTRTGRTWVVDPLDGTTNYLYGIPAWAVSVAVEDDAGGLAAVVHDPSAGETFTAVRGGGAHLDGARLAVSDLADPARALVATGFSYRAEERRVQAAALERVLPSVRDIRRPGSAALDLAWVACGRVDAYYEVPTMPWDRAAGVLLVREAGGDVTPLDPIGPGGSGVVAAGPALHRALAPLVRDALAAGAAGRRPENPVH